MKRRAPRPFSEAIGSLRDGLAPPGLLPRVQRVWEHVVGPATAAQATPTAERGGVVTISCSASVWAAELDMMSADLIARLNAQLALLARDDDCATEIAELRFRTR